MNTLAHYLAVHLTESQVNTGIIISGIITIISSLALIYCAIRLIIGKED